MIKKLLKQKYIYLILLFILIIVLVLNNKFNRNINEKFDNHTTESPTDVSLDLVNVSTNTIENTPYTTYRLYVTGFNAGDRLDAVYGNEDNELYIKGSFYQNEEGANTSLNIPMPETPDSYEDWLTDYSSLNPWIMALDDDVKINAYNGYVNGLTQEANELQYDSWVTIGKENQVGNKLADIGIDWTNFQNGGNIVTRNGSWYITPNDDQGYAIDGKVLIGQFTMEEGTIPDVLINIQGTKDGIIYNITGLILPTTTTTTTTESPTTTTTTTE